MLLLQALSALEFSIIPLTARSWIAAPYPKSCLLFSDVNIWDGRMALWLSINKWGVAQWSESKGSVEARVRLWTVGGETSDCGWRFHKSPPLPFSAEERGVSTRNTRIGCQELYNANSYCRMHFPYQPPPTSQLGLFFPAVNRTAQPIRTGPACYCRWQYLRCEHLVCALCWLIVVYTTLFVIFRNDWFLRLDLWIVM